MEFLKSVWETVKPIVMEPAVQQLVITAVVAVLGVVITYVQNKSAELTRKMAESTETKTKSGLLKEAALRAVMAVAMRKGDALKAAVADGKLSDEEKKDLSDSAKTIFMSELSTDMKAFLKQNYPDQEAFVLTSLDAAYAVYKNMKAGNAVAEVKKNS